VKVGVVDLLLSAKDETLYPTGTEFATDGVLAIVALGRCRQSSLSVLEYPEVLRVSRDASICVLKGLRYASSSRGIKEGKTLASMSTLRRRKRMESLPEECVRNRSTTVRHQAPVRKV
jgi:hypothetical protein